MRAEGTSHHAHASAAPEVLLNKKDIDKGKADCWSIGVILYQVEPQLMLWDHCLCNTSHSTRQHIHPANIDVPVQLLFGEHPFEKPADVEEGSVKRTLHRILKVTEPWHLTGLTRQPCLSQAMQTASALSFLLCMARWTTNCRRMPHRCPPRRWTCCSTSLWKTPPSVTPFWTCRMILGEPSHALLSGAARPAVYMRCPE